MQTVLVVAPRHPIISVQRINTTKTLMSLPMNKYIRPFITGVRTIQDGHRIVANVY